MPTQDRREFLKHTSAAVGSAAALAMTAAPASAAADDKEKPSGAGDKFVMGWIGCGGQATNLLKSFVEQPDVVVTWVCDPETARAEAVAKIVEEKTQKRPRIVADMRTVLDDKSVQAVVVATPDHWHAPATILACNAGKHVYVEKPCSHNIREGRLMVEAARKNDRVVQVGTQTRSSPTSIEAIKLLHDGAIGDVLVAKAWNSQLRGNIGHGAPSEPPAGFDFDLWVGPAPMIPFQANRVQRGWHWMYAFGTGDMGNDGVHDIDVARWGLGVDTHPTTVTAQGGKFFFDDDQEFPDTQYVVFDYPGDGKGPGDGKPGHRRQMIFEQRIWSPYRQELYENGCAFYGTKGMMLLGHTTGWKLFGPKNKLLDSRQTTLMGTPHHRDFLDCIKSGGRTHADIEIGHLSAALCHLGNVATRVGRTLHFDPQAEQIVGDREANQLVGRTYRKGHWAIPQGA